MEAESDVLPPMPRNSKDSRGLPEALLASQLVKNLPAVQETLVRFPGQEAPILHVLACRAPRTV